MLETNGVRGDTKTPVRRPWSLPCYGYDLLSIGPAVPLGPRPSLSPLEYLELGPPSLPRIWSYWLRHVQ